MEEPATDHGTEVEVEEKACPSWVVDMEKMMVDADPSVQEEQWRKHSIHRVPEQLKKMTNSTAYQPELVSLGPFHYGKPYLLPMEEHKRRALQHLVMRSGKPLRDFVAEVEEVAELLADAYEGLGEELRTEKKRDRFVELMVTDGCFLLEVMWVNENEGRVGEYYAPNDPVFSEHGYLYLFNTIMCDTLVMENQLPLLLLQRLAAVLHGERQSARDINEMVLTFLPHPHRVVGIDQLGLHPLDIFHKSFTHSPVEPNEAAGTNSNKETKSEKLLKILCGACRDRDCKGSKDEDDRETIDPAVELYEAGIHFEKSEAKGVQDIRFQRGWLSIPEITVDDYTEKKLLNLMAFERLHVDAGNDVTAYVFFVDNIIETDKDVALLRRNKIVDNMLGSNQDVAKLFNTLTNGAMLDRSSKLRDVKKKVNAYCDKRRNRWRASFMHTYLSNPWVFSSLAAAVILLAAAAIQTVYTGLSFYRS